MKLLKKIYRAIRFTIRTERAPRWVAEPIRTIANKTLGISVALTGLVVLAQQHIDFVPPAYRDRVSVVLVAAAAILVTVHRYAAFLGRSKVFSPATHYAEVHAAADAALAVKNGVIVDPAAVGVVDPAGISK